MTTALLKNSLWYSAVICVLFYCPLSLSLYNDSLTVPEPTTAQNPASQPDSTDYSYYDSQAPFQKPPLFPHDFQDQQIWLVPVLQYLLSIRQGSEVSISSAVKLLPIFIAGANWWFAEEQTEAIARQNGYTTLGTPFPSEALTNNNSPTLNEVPRKTTTKKRIHRASKKQPDKSGNQSTSPPPPSLPPGKHRRDNSGEEPHNPPLKKTKLNASSSGHVVYKDIEVGGLNYTISTHLTGDNEKLYCTACRDLVKPGAQVCCCCEKAICAEHLEKKEVDKCPSCRHKKFEPEDVTDKLETLHWDCPECNKAFTETNMHSHLLLCGPTFTCEHEGCEVTGNFGQVKAHEPMCEYKAERCPYPGCTAILIRRDLDSHCTACRKMPTQVPGTRLQGTLEQVQPVINAITALTTSGSHEDVFKDGFIAMLALTKTVTETKTAAETKSTATQAPDYNENRQSEESNGSCCSSLCPACPICKLEISPLESDFHETYCHRNYHFTGRRLVRYVSERAEENTFIMYRQGRPSIIAILPPGTIYRDMHRLIINYSYFDDSEYNVEVRIDDAHAQAALSKAGTPYPHFRLTLSIQDIYGNTLSQAALRGTENKELYPYTGTINTDQTLILLISVEA